MTHTYVSLIAGGVSTRRAAVLTAMVRSTATRRRTAATAPTQTEAVSTHGRRLIHTPCVATRTSRNYPRGWRRGWSRRRPTSGTRTRHSLPDEDA
jgi:hypothetical protein